MKHYLYVNEKGKKFKTTLAGKKQLETNRKLVASTKLLGECNENGVLLNQIPVLVAPPIQIAKADDFEAEVEKRLQARLKEEQEKTKINTQEVKFVEHETKRKYVKTK